jgi:hypothetical protein|tara:strand:- start:172 stop:435 length:264 start_codon:yes stop_codon:yes gene_type:complete
MCRGGPPTPISTPAPIQPRQPDLVRKSQLPGKKELVDPEDIADVEYGTGSGREAKDTRGQAKRQGTDALKINLQTPGGENTGGVSNV